VDINKFFQTKIFKGILIGLGAFLLLLVGFKAGLLVGFKKADFSRTWNDNYHRNFAGPQKGFFQAFDDDRDFIEANGVFGQVIKIDGSSLVVKGRHDVEKIIIINDDTIIKNMRQSVSPDNLKVDDYLVTIGQSDQAGRIEAKLIRVMPALPNRGEPAVPGQQPGEPMMDPKQFNMMVPRARF